MSQKRLSVSSFLQNLNAIDEYHQSPSSDSHHQSQMNNGNNGSSSSSSRHQNSNRPSSPASTPDDELAIFANTQFFDFDMGCSTDIAATMDDLLMQQEHQLQKSKGFSSSSSSGELMFNNGSLPSSSSASSSSQYQQENQIPADLLDLSNLQQFSLANELLPLNNNSSVNNTQSRSDHSLLVSDNESLSLNIHNNNIHINNNNNHHSNININSQQHEFTDSLTLTTQPRLSHLMASPALNSMISNNSSQSSSQSNNNNNANTTSFTQPHQNLTASQQLQLFIQQQIHAHGKAISPSISQLSEPIPNTANTSTRNNNNSNSKSSALTSQDVKGKSIATSLIKPAEQGHHYQAPSVDSILTPPNSKRRKSSRNSSVSVSSSSADNDESEQLEPARKVPASKTNPASESVNKSTTANPSTSTDSANAANPDEDKRRRNTAASARFRVKKKLREQEMERTTKELQDKVSTMETRIMQLEMENRWLKSLVVEKNEVRNTTELHDLKKKILEETSTVSAKF